MKLKILLFLFLFFVLKRYEFFVTFNPKKWITYVFNNCWSYVLDDIHFCNRNEDGKCNQRTIIVYTKKGEKLNCTNLLKGIKKDQKHIKDSNKNDKCPKNFYKVFFFVDDKNRAFHFLRQDKNGLWSHKQPNTKVSQLDSDGKVITDPENANYDYGYVNYTNKCSYLCVPENYYISTENNNNNNNNNMYRNIAR
jgi:hypothetical protein